MKHSKAKTTWLLVLMLAVLVAQTASACVAVPKVEPLEVTVQVGQTVPLKREAIADHDPDCAGRSVPLPMSGVTTQPLDTVATSKFCSSSQTVSVTGVAPGDTSMQIGFACLEPPIYVTYLWVTIHVVAAPTPPQPRPGGPASSDANEAAPPPERTLEKAVIGNCKEWVNVYVGPGTKQKVIGKAFLGEAIELIQWNHNETFCKVFYNGGDNLGWVQGKYIIPQK